MVKLPKEITGRRAAFYGGRSQGQGASRRRWAPAWLSTWRQSGLGVHEALRELVATLADAWVCADLHGHLVSWWEIVTGTTKVD